MAQSSKDNMVRYLEIDGYAEKRYRKIAGFFAEKSGRFLDIGCCQGGLAGYLKDFHYFGVDNGDNDFAGFTKIDLNQKKLPFEDGAFDAVNCSAVLEHLFYPLEMLQEIKRVLKKDGCALISLPNDKSLNALFVQLFVKVQDYEDAVQEHHWRFSIASARKFFEKEFRIIQEAPEFGPLFQKYVPFLQIKFLCTEWFMLGVKKT